MSSITEKEYKVIRGICKAMSYRYDSRHHMASRQDLYSAAIEEVTQSMDRFDWKKGHFRSYVTSCARRGVLEYLRKFSGSKRNPVRFYPSDFSDEWNYRDDYGNVHQPAVVCGMSEAAYNGTISFGQIAEVLPERERVIIYLYYYWNFTFGEIAECFGLTEARISQIAKASRELIQERHNGQLTDLREVILETAGQSRDALG